MRAHNTHVHIRHALAQLIALSPTRYPASHPCACTHPPANNNCRAVVVNEAPSSSPLDCRALLTGSRASREANVIDRAREKETGWLRPPEGGERGIACKAAVPECSILSIVDSTELHQEPVYDKLGEYSQALADVCRLLLMLLLLLQNVVLWLMRPEQKMSGRRKMTQRQLIAVLHV